MNWIQRTLAAAVAVALLATGCSRGTGDTSVTTIGLLSAALAETAEASSYRESLSFGVVWKIGGDQISTELDENNPVMVGEVSAERGYFRFDVGKFLDSIIGFSFDFLDDLRLEMWANDERIVFDTSALQPLVDADPDFDLGPLKPGVFFIDLNAIEADRSEFMNAVAGSSTPDLSDMAKSLPAALISIEQTSTDPSTFVGTTTSARLSEALGYNIVDDARSDASDLDIAFSGDPEELADLFVQMYETNTVEVVIELDDRGLLKVLWTDEDFSGIFRALAKSEDFGTEFSEEERQETLELLESIEFRLATRVAYESDADIEVSLPPLTTEDRTEEWREFLAEGGFGG